MKVGGRDQVEEGRLEGGVGDETGVERKGICDCSSRYFHVSCTPNWTSCTRVYSSQTIGHHNT